MTLKLRPLLRGLPAYKPGRRPQPGQDLARLASNETPYPPLPSVIDAPANRKSQPDADHSKWVAPEAIAKVVRFLISDESAPMSGAAVPVYGRA